MSIAQSLNDLKLLPDDFVQKWDRVINPEQGGGPSLTTHEMFVLAQDTEYVIDRLLVSEGLLPAAEGVHKTILYTTRQNISIHEGVRIDMSNVALGRNGVTYYADNFKGEINAVYKCPGVGCGCDLKPKNINGSSNTKRYIRPYFTAFNDDRPGHIEGCGFAVDVVSSAKLETAGFSADSFIDSLTISGRAKREPGRKRHEKDTHGDAQRAPIRNIAQLWNYCRQHEDNHIMPCGSTIGSIYEEKRNLGRNIKRNDRRLALLGFDNCRFDKEDTRRLGILNIWCYVPHDDPDNNKHRILGFKNCGLGLDIMRRCCRILNEIKKQNNGNAYLVVAGAWEGVYCPIVSDRQIYLVSGQICL
jgi:hypothetical protein